jgi:hypothetical protein
MGELIAAGDTRLAPATDIAVALAQLDLVPPGDEAMEGARQQIIALSADAPALADRSWRPGHLTGSALVVDSPDEHLALMFHAKLRKWLQPGGHADGDTNLMAVALDTAPLDIDVHEVRPPKEDAHLHLDLRFLIVAPPGAVLVANHESTELRWVSWDDLESYDPDPSLRRLSAAARQRLSAC